MTSKEVMSVQQYYEITLTIADGLHNRRSYLYILYASKKSMLILAIAKKSKVTKKNEAEIFTIF